MNAHVKQPILAWIDVGAATDIPRRGSRRLPSPAGDIAVFRTGDGGYVDDQNRLYWEGRLSDIIKTGGEWISSLQLEDVIERRVGVAECAVIGVKDDRWGERPLALIVRDPKTMPPVSEEDIKAHALSYSKKGMISKFAVPQKILFVEALAKTSVGKFDKKALRAQYGESA